MLPLRLSKPGTFLVLETKYMETLDFLKLNIVIVGTAVLAVFVYLIFLINKRRKEKFLHRDPEKEKL